MQADDPTFDQKLSKAFESSEAGRVYTAVEIAQMCGCTARYILKIQDTALKKLRKKLYYQGIDTTHLR